MLSLTVIYLLTRLTPSPPDPLNDLLSLGSPLGGKFDDMRGVRFSMRHRPKGGQRSKRNGWDKNKE